MRKDSIKFGIVLFSSLQIASASADPAPAVKDLITPYGFVKAGVISASRAVDSAQWTNLSCPLLSHPDIGPNDGAFRSSFQVAQSRIGFWVQKDENPVKGQFEFDFLHLDKASPTIASYPRLRIAKVSYNLGKEHEFNFGQDWDPFSPFRPFSNGMMGILFQSGNVGFMRHQAKWLYKSESFSYALAAVIAGRNDGTTDNTLELGATPGLTQQLTLNVDKAVKVGTSVTFSLPKANNVQTSFYGLNLFTSMKWEGLPEFRLMTYYGQDLQTAGFNGIGSGGNHEAGGYLAFNGVISGPVIFSGGAGMAYVMETNGSALSYISGYRLKDNSKVDFSLGYKLTNDLKLYSEYVYILSHYVGSSGGNIAFVPAHVLDVGARFDF